MNSLHPFLRRGYLAIALTVLAACCFTPAARAGGGPPVIDGNINDLINYAQQLESAGLGCGLILTDNSGLPETIYNDIKFIPCPLPQPAVGTHWVNGTEIFNHYLAYDHGSSTLYLAIRSEGFIGDADGNDNPDTFGGGSCNLLDNVEDTNGISGNELYSWSFDLNCDTITDGTIKIQDNAVVGTGVFAGATGTCAFRQDAVSGATGHDLEVQVNLAAALPAAFDYVRAETNAFDGLSEDRADGELCISTPRINVLKDASPATICPGGTTRFTTEIGITGGNAG
jgi:hypothetical protein